MPEENQRPSFTHLFQIHLLFERNGIRPSAAALQEAARPTLGDTDVVAEVKNQLTTLAVKRFQADYKDAQRVPAQVLMADFAPFDSASIDQMQRSQFWECPQGGELLDRCGIQVMLSDFMAAGLPYKERCTLLTGWLEAVLSLFPDCLAVWVPSAWKLLTPAQVLDNSLEGPGRFLHFGVNARFFRIQGTEDMLVDTLGLHALGLPDVQYHFHGLDPNHVVNHAYNVASYIFDNDAPIRGGETIDGLRDGRIDQTVQWKCQYETAMVAPQRDVMDICPGPYAAGDRS